MVFGWRKAFCTSVSSNQQQSSSSSHILQTDPPIPTPRLRSKFGFFSNPSTPRLRSRGGRGGSGIGCRSAASTAAANPSLPTSPKLHCRTTSNATPRTSNSSTPKLLSNPSSPKSSSSSSSHGGVSLLRATLLLNKSNNSRCGICLQRLNSGQINSTATFTAECSHSFHLSCAAKLDEKRCPFCSAAWNHPPRSDPPSANFGSDPWIRPEIREIKTGKSLRVYNDDEPLAYSPVSLAHFNSIPESDENDDDDQFPGFFSDSSTTPSLPGSIPPISGNLEVKFLPESAAVETGKRMETRVVTMKLKASSPSSTTTEAARASRPSIDLVTVLDLNSGGADLRTVKHALRLVISLLRETDRLSIVAFSSAGSKRLMPLRRMTDKGRRSARRIVDALVGIETTGGGGMSVSDALKKAVKVVEDRRERNPSASILVLSDGQDQAVTKAKLNSARAPFVVSTTRFSRLEIPVHSVWIASQSALHHAPLRDAFTERIASLLYVVLHDVKLNLGLVSGSPLAEISAVYSLTGRSDNFGSGSAVIVGDLFAEEEREYLVEFKVPTSSSGSHHVMSVRSSVVDPATLQPFPCPKEKRFLIPRPQTVRFESSSIERLRSAHLVCRAVAGSRKLIERDDIAGAYQLLTTARSNASDDSLMSLNAELAELSRLKPRNGLANRTEEKPEQLTPTSAWKAAEKLAKVAIMRKHLNRVSDMHGLENARF
ncbi:Zinc finger (C3HC4-type RING finger) family protein [Raphanus sativus]|uniref:RING-type E3 ubiquitin transferase n=1 Tax=Raphanus sativus TaxID=3726 RepID=A0A6J0NNN0_RAPSA|nr:probable E3 ubiquitin-protein ligase WAVH2 [Raphanus sativus]KAJ4897171.1 Zinc finger (C3HC4-type RING finger) family protein [Raphanus sativus]